MAPSPTKEQAKRTILAQLKAGATVPDALKAAGIKSRKTYDNYRSEDPEWRGEIDAWRQRRADAKDAGKDPELYQLSFEEWRRRFLHQETYPHQRMWIDVLEGREPDVFHPSITYIPRDPDRIIINTPPGHAKSTTITAQYSTYKLCMNPAFRIIIISETGEFATKFLYQIRQYLTSPNYIELQQAYGPPEGFRPERGQGRWTNNLIYLAGRQDEDSEKDPSVTALGIKGQVYGSRADLVILDDAVTGKNAAEYEKQFDWLNREVLTRGLGMKVLVVGTRIQPNDLYSHLLNDENYITGETPWTYLSQPAILEGNELEDPAEWVCLWPRSSQPYDNSKTWETDEDGLYPAMDGPHLMRFRNSMRPGQWALVFQQQQVGEDMTFQPICVWGSTNKRRKPGPLRAGGWGHPEHGAEGMTVIGSIDPAGTGEAFILVYAVDRRTQKRYVLNAWIGNNTMPSWYADMIEQITPEYGVTDWIVEKQGYSNWIYQDPRITRYCQTRGLKLYAHYTGNGNKIDPDFGVASMASLFGSMHRIDDGNGNMTGRMEHAGDNVIELPDPTNSRGIKALIDQLLVWTPGKSGAKLRQDGPMALWFAEVAGRRYLIGGDRPLATHSTNRFASRARLTRRGVAPAGYFLDD